MLFKYNSCKLSHHCFAWLDKDLKLRQLMVEVLAGNRVFRFYHMGQHSIN